MNIDRNVRTRRFAGLAIAVAALLALGACGRANNITVPVASGPVTWDNTIRHLLADRSSGTKPTGCTSCHHAGTGIPDWGDYDTVVGYKTNIYTRLSPGGNMRQFLADASEAQVVLDWINAGTPR